MADLTESDAVLSSADSAPAGSQVPESAGGFQYRPWNSDGTSLSDSIRQVLKTSYTPNDCSKCGRGNCYCDVACNE